MDHPSILITGAAGFAGRHLLLLDARSNMIVDEIPFALPCDGCPLKRSDDEH